MLELFVKLPEEDVEDILARQKALSTHLLVGSMILSCSSLIKTLSRKK